MGFYKVEERVRGLSCYGVGLIPRIAGMRTLAWVATASTCDMSSDHAGWWVVSDLRVVIPIAYNHRNIWRC